MVFADSFNLARRLSTRAENDLLQENMGDSKYSLEDCKAIASKISSVQSLPSTCYRFDDVLKNFEAQPNESDLSIAFDGMGSAAAAAVRARKTGKENYPQIQRRFTNTKRFSKN